MKRWYCRIEGQQHGPLEERTLRQYREDGRLAESDLVWTCGMAEWMEFQNVPRLNLPAEEAPPQAPEASLAEFYEKAPLPPPIHGMYHARQVVRHHGLLWLILGIPSLVLFLFAPLPILVCYFSWRDLEAMELGRMDSGGRTPTWIGFLLSGLGCFLFLVFLLAAFLAYAFYGYNVFATLG